MRTIALLFLLLVSETAFSQAPHLNGKVEIDMKTGQITCDFELSKIPNLGKDYQIAKQSP